MSRLTTQRDAVLEALLSGEAADPTGSSRALRVLSAGARIRELREVGYLILSLREPGSDGFVTYILLDERGAAR